MFARRFATRVFAPASRSTIGSSLVRAVHTNTAHSNQSSRTAFFTLAAGTAGAAAGVWAFVKQQQKQQQQQQQPPPLSIVPVAAAESGEVANRETFVVFRHRVLPLWYRVVLVFFSIVSGGLLYAFIQPVLLFNHLEEAVPQMSVGGKQLAWVGKFSDFYWLSMRNLALTVVTLGFYHVLGYSDQRTEAFIDRHIMFAEDWHREAEKQQRS